MHRVKRTRITEMGIEPGVAKSIRFDGHLVSDRGEYWSGMFVIHGWNVTWGRPL